MRFVYGGLVAGVRDKSKVRSRRTTFEVNTHNENVS